MTETYTPARTHAALLLTSLKRVISMTVVHARSKDEKMCFVLHRDDAYYHTLTHFMVVKLSFLFPICCATVLTPM